MTVKIRAGNSALKWAICGEFNKKTIGRCGQYAGKPGARVQCPRTNSRGEMSPSLLGHRTGRGRVTGSHPALGGDRVSRGLRSF